MTKHLQYANYTLRAMHIIFLNGVTNLDKINLWIQFIHKEGGVRGSENRTEIRQKTANHTGFIPEYRNRMYMEATM